MYVEPKALPHNEKNDGTQDHNQEQLQRYQQLGKLCAALAHELNNPIGYILTNLASFQFYVAELQNLHQQLALWCSTTESQQNSHPEWQKLQQLMQQVKPQPLLADCDLLLSDCVFGANRLRELLMDLRRFGYPDAEALEPVVLQPICQQTLRLFKNLQQSRCTITLDLPPLPLTVMSHSGALHQILLNLLLNSDHALAAQPPQAEPAQIWLYVRPLTSQTSLPETSAHATTVVEIWLGDNGPNLPKARQTAPFALGHTSKGSGHGSGQGLAICQSLAHKCKIELSYQQQWPIATQQVCGAIFCLRFMV